MCLALPGLILSITTQPGPGQLLKQSEFDLQANGEDFPAGSDLTARASTAEAAVPAPCQPETTDPLWLVADVDFGGVRQPVSLACLPEARVGDRVLVHVGIALSIVEEESV
jgi:hydrogenase expression/formation protein HypC